MNTLIGTNESEARAIVRSQLTGTDSCDQVAEDCALLRSSLWALTEGTRPCHILRLMNLAISLRPWISDSRERLRAALMELSESGDFAELANGLWLPAPTRQVKLETQDDLRLLIGGFPTSLLAREKTTLLEHVGSYRRFKGEAFLRNLSLQEQPRDAWLGHTPEDLRDWTDSVLKGRLEPYRLTGKAIEVYAPDQKTQTVPQALRWTELQGDLNGIYLAREEVSFRGKRFLICEIISGRVVAVRTAPSTELRRLMYGIDLLANKSVAVQEVPQSGKSSLILKSELPQSEQRMLAALGSLTVSTDGYYPRTWSVSQEHVVDVKKRLALLGVTTFVKA